MMTTAQQFKQASESYRLIQDPNNLGYEDYQTYRVYRSIDSGVTWRYMRTFRTLDQSIAIDAFLSYMNFLEDERSAHRDELPKDGKVIEEYTFLDKSE